MSGRSRVAGCGSAAAGLTAWGFSHGLSCVMSVQATEAHSVRSDLPAIRHWLPHTFHAVWCFVNWRLRQPVWDKPRLRRPHNWQHSDTQHAAICGYHDSLIKSFCAANAISHLVCKGDLLVFARSRGHTSRQHTCRTLTGTPRALSTAKQGSE
jgi:hypothetical protein